MNTVNTVCLCGSTRFKRDFDKANRALTLQGLSVITISFAAEKDETGLEKEPAAKELLDLVHLNKILRSDAVLVVGDGYVGFSTAREMLWADMHGKPLHAQWMHTAIGKPTEWTALAYSLRYVDDRKGGHAILVEHAQCSLLQAIAAKKG